MIGRPHFNPTPEQRRAVAQLRALGTSEAGIARALGISRPTLRLHFASQLRNGWAIARAHLVELLWRQARRGHVGSLIRLERMTRSAAHG